MQSVAHHVTAKGNTFQRIEVITGEQRRRAWSIGAKQAIVAESFATTTSISDVARRHGINRNQLFAWRRQFQNGELGVLPAAVDFVPVTIDETAPTPGSSGQPREDGGGAEAIVEVVVGGMTVRVPPSADEAHLRRVLAAVRSFS